MDSNQPLSLVSHRATVLHQPTSPVVFDHWQEGELLKLCDAMWDTMVSSNGIGLAAPQVGLSHSIFVMVGPNDAPLYCINPSIEAQSDEAVSMVEGCLSYPNLFMNLKRPSSIVAQYYTPVGHLVTRDLSGIHARCFQHEYDHLQGICFVDKVSQTKLHLAKKRQHKRGKIHVPSSTSIR